MKRRFAFAGGSLPLGDKIYIMGILNVTPDSFYDGGRYFDPSDAVKKAVALAAEGADILDVGAVSTRPNASRADEAEELRRLRAVLPAIRREVALPISVDTYRPAAARYCLDAGADIVNDVSGVFDPEMAETVRSYGAGWVVMHAGPPGARTADKLRYPGGVTADVQRFFNAVTQRIADARIPPENVCLDPGFGFAKTNWQNECLLRELPSLSAGASALLVGLSRKRFVAAKAKNRSDGAVLAATVRADLRAVRGGADVLRVHDVAAHFAALSGCSVPPAAHDI